MAKSELVMLTARTLTVAEWQRAIDAQDFLVPLVLDQSRIGPGTTTYHGKLGGAPISFLVEPRELSSLGLALDRLRQARFAFATPERGEMERCAAGGMALWAYGAAAGGAVFEPVDGEIIEMGRLPLKQQLDAMLALAFNRERDYEARYPAAPQDGDRPPEAIARFAD